MQLKRFRYVPFCGCYTQLQIILRSTCYAVVVWLHLVDCGRCPEPRKKMCFRNEKRPFLPIGPVGLCLLWRGQRRPVTQSYMNSLCFSTSMDVLTVDVQICVSGLPNVSNVWRLRSCYGAGWWPWTWQLKLSGSFLVVRLAMMLNYEAGGTSISRLDEVYLSTWARSV